MLLSRDQPESISHCIDVWHAKNSSPVLCSVVISKTSCERESMNGQELQSFIDRKHPNAPMWRATDTTPKTRHHKIGARHDCSTSLYGAAMPTVPGEVQDINEGRGYMMDSDKEKR